MNREDALKQIELISNTIENNNTILLSSKLMVSIGIMVLLIPVIEYSTDYMTLGIKTLDNTITNTIIHIVVYWVIFTIIHKICLKGESKNHTHNITVKKALKPILPITVAILGLIGCFVATNNSDFICPIVLILIGILYNIIGQFSIKSIRIISWSYIIIGLIMCALLNYNISYMWIIFTTYLGISYIIMGLLIRGK